MPLRAGASASACGQAVLAVAAFVQRVLRNPALGSFFTSRAMCDNRQRPRSYAPLEGNSPRMKLLSLGPPMETIGKTLLHFLD
jgi:hypothetical protein